MFKDVQQLKLAILEKQCEQLRATTMVAGQQDKLHTLEAEMLKIAQATSLVQLGLTPLGAVKLLQEYGIMPVLDSDDCVTIFNARHIQSPADLIAVHQMNFMPMDNRLKTPREMGVKITDKVTLNNRKYQYSYALERNTTHITLNGEIANENCQYVVLQPFEEIPHEQIIGVTPRDTYFRGGLNLTANAWILCPANEVKKVRKFNPHCHVLGYVTENASGLATAFLSQLGYHAQTMERWGWSDYQNSQQELYALAERERWSLVPFYDSTDYEDERFQTSSNKVIAMMKMLIDKKLVQSVKDFQQLRPQLFTQTDFHFAMKNMMRMTMVRDAQKIPDAAIVANGRQALVLAEKMARVGMPLTQTEQMILQLQFSPDDTGVAREIRHGLSSVEFVTRLIVQSALRACVKKLDYLPQF